MNNYPQTADIFVEQLSAHASPDEAEKRQRHFSGDDETNQFLGVRMGTIFQLAKKYTDMSLDEIEQLLESPYYEVRMGGVSIMDYQARKKKLPDGQRKALFDLYIRRHDRLNNWDFPDRAAPHVVGRFLIDKPRDVLYELAQSNNIWERRTAIVSTAYFLRQGEVEDTFEIAKILIDDEHELTQKAIGSWLREAGKVDETRLRRFLDKHGSIMSRVALRLAVAKLDESSKKHYLAKT